MELKVTNKIKLKTLEEEQAEDLFDLLNKNREYLSKWLEWMDAIREVEDIEKFLQKEKAEWNNKTGLYMGILDQEELIGSCSFSRIDSEHGRAVMSYWLSEDKQGQGIMIECVKSLIEYGFMNLELNKIRIQVNTKNVKSIKIPEKLDFNRDGILRQHARLNGEFEDLVEFSLLKNEWDRHKRG